MTSDEAPNSTEAAVEDLTQRLGRTPRPSELSWHMRIPLDEVIEAVAEHREPRTHTDWPDEPPGPPAPVVDEPTPRELVARALASEADTHRRAIECHETAVANLSGAGDFEGAEAARVRLANARKRLNECLEQERLLLRPGYAAMAADPREIAHAVAVGRSVSACGLQVAHMVGVAEDFTSLPPSRRCVDCVQAMQPQP